MKKLRFYAFEKKKKYFYIGIICGVMLLTLLIFNTSRAKYRTTQSIELARGTINYTVPDLNLVSMYIEDNGEYKASDTVPSNGYKLNQDKSYCAVNGNKDSSITFGYENKLINVYGLGKKGTKCYLYFDSYQCNGISCESILANINTIKTRNDFSIALTDATSGVIYKSLDSTQYDDYGATYYFAGAPTDNWVKFGGYYWRIIRINGDGTIRMIYNGPTTDQTGETTQIGESAFASALANDNMYVGFQYTNGEVHGRGANSAVKEALDNWYSSNLSGYTSYIATGEGATFCNDRQPSTNDSSLNNTGGTGKTLTYYAPHLRLDVYKNPIFNCVDINDRIDTPIGLITVDEMAYAGGVNQINNLNYYLYNNKTYWSMSPCIFDIYGYALVFHMALRGAIDAPYAHGANGVRPVINLRKDIQFTGLGTALDPYVVT